MSQRKLVISAIVANTLVAAIAYALYGWTRIGAHVAARSTARFAALVFVIAFAQPGLARWIASLPSYATLVYAWVAAHCVHFVAVAITFALDRSPHPHLAEIVVVGFTIVVISGVTVGHSVSRAMRVIHAVAIYATFLVFMLAFATNRFVPLRALAVLLVLSLALRVAGMMTAKRTPITA